MRNTGKLAAAEPSQCGFGSPWKFKPDPDRFTSCSDVWWEVATYEDHADGTVDITGSLNMNNRQWNIYDRKALTWTHGLTIQTHEGEGTLEDGTPATTVSLCRSQQPTCKILSGNPPQVTAFVPQTRYSFQWVEEAVGVANDVADGNVVPQAALGVQLTSNGTNDVPPWNFTDRDLWGRCDRAVKGAPTAGCVNPYFTPTLTLERYKHGAAADMIAWAQQQLTGAWGRKGSGPPLHRLTDEIIRDNNREILCGPQSGWMQDPGLNTDLQTYPPDSQGTPEKDSCDEYPFAASYESGAMEEDVNGDPKPFVTSGARCAQVIAYQTGATGVLATDFANVKPLVQATGHEACVRGHIPLSLNRLAGSAYQTECLNSRVISKDEFWVAVR